MRRSRFAQSVESNELRARAPRSVTLCGSTVTRPDTTDEESLCDWRVAGLQHAPLILGVTHLLITITCMLLVGSAHYKSAADNPLIPAALVIALDVAAAVLILQRAKFRVSPRTPSSAACASILRWSACFGLGSATRSPTIHSPFRLPRHRSRCAPGIAMGPSFRSARRRWCWSTGRCRCWPRLSSRTSPLIPAGVGDSLAGAGRLQHRRRAQLHCDRPQAARARGAGAQGAQHFVDEFENSGRGWFWETDSRGTLSYVSRQLADDFQCEPEALLGRQFTDLLSVDRRVRNRSKSARRSASICPPASRSPTSSSAQRASRTSTGRCRATRSSTSAAASSASAASAPISPSSASPEREISRLASFDSLTGLPNRAMMRQTLDEALRNAAHRQKGCALVHDRPRPVQERQRHARPPGRRRAAAPGRRAADVGDGQSRPGRPARRRRIPGGAARQLSTSACSNRSPAR